MSQKHSTVKRTSAATKTRTPSKFEKAVRAVPTERDHALARQLVAIYKDKHTPEMIKAALFRLFCDLFEHYKVSHLIPKNFTRFWLKLWPALLARVGKEGHMPTAISYTWQPTPEDEAELDAAEEEETSARMMFNFCNNPELEGLEVEQIRDSVISILNLAPVGSTWEVFRVAWPLALQKLTELNEDRATANGSERATQ